MADKSIVSNTKLDALAQAIATKAGATLPLTMDKMKEAVDSIETGGGEDLDKLVENTFSGAYEGKVSSVGPYKFNDCDQLTSVKLTPRGSGITIGQYAFIGCSALTNFEVTKDCEVTVNGYAFQGSGIVDLKIPLFTTDYNAFFQMGHLKTFKGTHHRPAGYTYLPPFLSPFSDCSQLELVDLDMSMIWGGYASHWDNKNLKTIVLRDTEVMATMTVAGLLNNLAHVKDGTLKIYVPDNFLADYKAATNWVTYADLIHPLSEYTEE